MEARQVDAITKQFVVPVIPTAEPRLPVVYPWEQTNIFNLCQQLYELAAQTGYKGTFDEFRHYFGEYLESGDSIIDYDEYTGQYSVTPLPNVEQILRTRNKVLKHDVVIEPIPYAEVSNSAGGVTCIIG